jgi:signal transduction histidine kinase/CheY-like chemotaxis protein
LEEILLILFYSGPLMTASLVLLAVILVFVFLLIYKHRNTKYFSRISYRQRRIVHAARQTVVDRMSEGMIVVDVRNVVIHVNPPAARFFRIDPSMCKGMAASVLFGDSPSLAMNLRYSARKNQEVQIGTGNDVTWFMLDINPLFSRRGTIWGKMLVFHDITPLKLAEHKLIEAKARAEQSDNLKSAFLANMSHEIRTPMNVIIGFSNLLNDAEVSAIEREEFIGHIRNSGNSLLQLIDDIIDVSKLDAGQMMVDVSRMSVSRMLAELFSWFNENLLEEGKENIQLLVTGISGTNELIVAGDAPKINRIMRHLIANAVKFTTTGYIEFGAQIETPGQLLLYVQDSGIGIAKEKQGMIFERFSRVMTGTRQEYGGTGMGLAICKGLAELLGGKIWVESSLGAGSTFYVQLPVTATEEIAVDMTLSDLYGIPVTYPALRVREVPAEPGLIYESIGSDGISSMESWRSKTILILEEDEIGYLNIEMILRTTHANLVWVRSVAEASNYLDGNNKMDAAVVSASLTGADLAEVTGLLFARIPELPVVAIIPDKSSAAGNICRDLGCSACLPRPVMPGQLLAALAPFMTVTASDLLFLRAN